MGRHSTQASPSDSQSSVHIHALGGQGVNGNGSENWGLGGGIRLPFAMVSGNPARAAQVKGECSAVAAGSSQPRPVQSNAAYSLRATPNWGPTVRMYSVAL